MVTIDSSAARDLSLRRSLQRWTLVLFAGIAAINLLAVASGVTPYIRAHLAAAALAGYLAFEAMRFLRRTDVMGLLTPAFLALFGHFTLAYLCLITLSAFDTTAISYYHTWLHDPDGALADTILLAALAAFSMMRAYELTQPLARRLRRAAQGWRALRRELRPAMSLAVILQFAFVGLVGLAMNLGVYGVGSDAEAKLHHIDVIQYLRILVAAGTLSYFLILMRYFEGRAAGKSSFWFGAFCTLLVAFHVLAGALAAFKSQIVMPFIVAGLAYFLVTRRIPRTFFLMAVAALVLSYSVVQPLRSYLGYLGENRPRGLIEAVETVATAVRLREQFEGNTDTSLGEQIALRFDVSGMSAVGIDFVQRGYLQPDVRQDLQDSILLAPVLAFVPRLIWRNKGSYSTGVWFNVTVLRKSDEATTSVGMGPIAYLYMAGGVLMVCFGFALWGAMGSLLFDGLARSGAGGVIVFLSVASSLVSINTSFGPILTGNLRMIVVAFAAQLILLRPSRRAARS